MMALDQFPYYFNIFQALVAANILDNNQQLIIPSKHREVLYSSADLFDFINKFFPVLPADYKATTNIPLSLLQAGYDLPDGTLVAEDIVCLMAQTDPTQNGLWKVRSAPYLPDRPSYFISPFTTHHGKLVLIRKVTWPSDIIYRVDFNDPNITIQSVIPTSTSDLITDSTVISMITNSLNWNDNGIYIGLYTGLIQDNYYIDYTNMVMYKYDGTNIIRFNINNVF